MSSIVLKYKTTFGIVVKCVIWIAQLAQLTPSINLIMVRNLLQTSLKNRVFFFLFFFSLGSFLSSICSVCCCKRCYFFSILCVFVHSFYVFKGKWKYQIIWKFSPCPDIIIYKEIHTPLVVWYTWMMSIGKFVHSCLAMNNRVKGFITIYTT